MREGQATIEVLRNQGSVILRVSGEFDVSSASSVYAATIRAIRLHPALEMDLSDVTFMDSSGLYVLLATGQRAERNGGRLRLLHPSPRVMRVLEAAGDDGRFDIETGDSAVGAREQSHARGIAP
jgi:stage II sporulation protein AA (anti-sigma F factor antagonist)